MSSHVFWRRGAWAALAFWAAAAAAPAAAQETVEEAGKHFPTQVTMEIDGETQTLSLSGTAVRKKFVVKVYALAHYMAAGPFASEDAALAAALDDGPIRQLTLDFNRGVGADKIQEAFREGFEKNATTEEAENIRAAVEQFVGYFASDVAENAQYVLCRLPDGTVMTTVAGEEKPAIANPDFARVLWRIWLGEKAIVDRKKLVRRAVAGEDD